MGIVAFFIEMLGGLKNDNDRKCLYGVWHGKKKLIKFWGRSRAVQTRKKKSRGSWDSHFQGRALRTQLDLKKQNTRSIKGASEICSLGSEGRG
jgi:hypothetical protein